MPTPKRMENGKWTIRVYDYQDADGKQHYKRITADTKARCAQLAAVYQLEKGKKKTASPLTVGEAVDQYIEMCQLLSPTTLRSYNIIRRDGFPHLMTVAVGDLTEQQAQAAINQEAMRTTPHGRISPKTVSNEWGLISSALWHVCRVRFDVKLPKKHRKIKEYPDPAEVYEMIRGTSIELPCMLALWLSFTMSEVRGLRWDDISSDGSMITINRVIVDVGTLSTVKENAKTETRLRRHRIPPYIRQLLDEVDRESEYIVPLTRSQLHGRFTRLCKRHGLDLTFHDLRHLNASVMLQLNVPEKYAMERGGWKTPHTMKTVYQHTFSAQRRAVDDQVDAYFDAIVGNNMT